MTPTPSDVALHWTPLTVLWTAIWLAFQVTYRPRHGRYDIGASDVRKRGHAVHHATSGDLDQRGIGDATTLTVAEYFPCPTSGGSCVRKCVR